MLEGVPDEIRRKLPDEVVDELLAGAISEEEIVGPGGLLSQLTKRLVERALEVELTDHVGYERHQEPPGGGGNTRNGKARKTLVSEHGRVEIDTPRDRDGSFEPQLVRKRQRRFEGFDEKILALYSRGLSTRDIEAYLRELYGVSVGRELISRVSDAVMDDARAWQQRPSDDVYPVVFLDCLVLKIKDGGSVQRQACYIALAISMTGEREVLGLWFQENEGAKFWMQVLSELKHRGVREILITCVDGLKGVPRGDRGGVPAHGAADVHRAPGPHLTEICPPPRLRQGRQRPPADLHSNRCRARPPSLARVRGGLGRAAPASCQSVARRVGARDPVHVIPARSPPGHLHDKFHRSSQPAAEKGRQDQDNATAFQKRLLYLDVKEQPPNEDESGEEESGDTEEYLFRFENRPAGSPRQ
jgi:hypothetical protein